MPLSWNEIKDRALAFANEWADAKDEKSEAQRFWIAFFDIFGFTKQRVIAFEHAITRQGAAYMGNRGWIDLLWPGVLDFVAAWHVRAAYCREATAVHDAGLKSWASVPQLMA